MPADLILHHYPASPFSEKVRLVLGAKKLAYRSVTIPMIMPKPDVLALTGGYRKTPLLQVGADVYCDSALICRVIDARSAEPALYAPASGGTAELVAQWADATLFWAAVPYALQPAGIAAMFKGAPPEMLKAFFADRLPFAPNLGRVSVPDATAALHGYLGWLEAMLADGRSYLMSGGLSIADFSVAHCLWFIRNAPPVAGVLDAFPRLTAWLPRVQAFGHGDPVPMSSTDALAAAAEAASAGAHAKVEVMPGLGFEAGEAVSVAAADYGCDAVHGSLVGLTHHSVTVCRRDERAGVLQVHFPRAGFLVRKDGAA